MSAFDLKFGKKFLDSIPPLPGIYRIFDSESTLIYIGKAKNLKRRLGQYKNAKRRRKHRKMRKIIESAASIQFETCATECEAELLEASLIQLHRPRWNVVGAFYFLYPMVGMKHTADASYFCYTTQPELFEDFEFHGAYRSRDITRDAFFSLVELLKYVGHPLPKIKSYQDGLIPKYSYLYGFRQIPSDWLPLWADLWRGSSKYALEVLVLALIENAGARKDCAKTQELLNKLRRFWIHEATPLFKACSRLNHESYPISQKERDLLFLKYRHSFLKNESVQA